MIWTWRVKTGVAKLGGWKIFEVQQNIALFSADQLYRHEFNAQMCYLSITPWLKTIINNYIFVELLFNILLETADIIFSSHLINFLRSYFLDRSEWELNSPV